MTEGEKGQPTNTLANSQFWRWPYWDKDSVYLTTKSAFGKHETLKIKLYHDTFNNAIDMYRDASFTTLSGGPGTGQSIYNDKTEGGSMELESTRFWNQTLRLFAFYKKDSHDKNDYSGTSAKFDRMQDTLVSYALEDNIQLRNDLLLSLGASHHALKPVRIYKSDARPALSLPGKKTANDIQAGLYHDLNSSARLYATASTKTQLPSLASRYNSAFGSYVENPALQPEKSRNYEVGYQGTPWPGTKAEAAFFYSNVKDKIQTWYPNPALPCTAKTNVCQTRNVGEVRYTGVELGLSGQLRQIELGGNITWTDPKVISNPNNRGGAKVTDVPKQKIVLHALWRPSGNFDLVAFIENNSKRWVSDTVELGAHTTLNLKAAYHPLKDVTIEAGVNNLNDRNFSLANGFPQPGRMWFANGSYKF